MKLTKQSCSSDAMGEGEVTQLKVEIAEIKTTLKAFIKEMKENSDSKDRIAVLEREKIIMEMRAHRTGLEHEISVLRDKISLNRKIAWFAIVVAGGSAGLKAYNILAI